jgi:hypothetical protein
LKQKAFTIALMVIMSTALLISMGFSAQGQTDVIISSVTSNGASAPYVFVDQAITIAGAITTLNGAYTIDFAGTRLASGNAQGYTIKVNATIPVLLSGNYGLVLTDVASGQTASYPLPLQLNYLIDPLVPLAPSLQQEGKNLVLNVTITGAPANVTYTAEVTVAMPSALDINYTTIVSLTSNSLGVAQTSVNFPAGDYSPPGASTAYAGTYVAYFNGTQPLAVKSFPVGFTDLSEYHRGSTVKVNAVGYQPNQVCTLAVKFNDNVVFSQTVTASGGGIVSTTWTVPDNASEGTYTATISTQVAPAKDLVDTQTFSIVGYPITFQAVNLAGQSVSSILVKATDKTTGDTFSNTTRDNGIAVLNLEKGTYTVEAFWNNAQVDTTTIIVNGSASVTLRCTLGNLNVKVQDKNGIAIPFVNVTITFSYSTPANGTSSSSQSASTDLSGNLTFASLLTGISYSLQASKYGQAFASNSFTLQAQGVTVQTITCPDETLSLTIVDYYSSALPDAHVVLTEQTSGLFYSVTTDSNGNAQATVTFGKYDVSVYTYSNVLLKQTTVDVLSSTNSQIRCVVYNLPVTVKVVDYFGNGIGNVNVQFSRTGTETRSSTTQGDGTASFSNVIGGNVEITAYLSGNQNSFVAANLQVDSPSTLTLSMSKYVSLGGAVIETSTLTTIILIVITILVLLVLEVFRRKGFPFSRKTKS